MLEQLQCESNINILTGSVKHQQGLHEGTMHTESHVTQDLLKPKGLKP